MKLEEMMVVEMTDNEITTLVNLKEQYLSRDTEIYNTADGYYDYSDYSNYANYVDTVYPNC